MSEYRRRTAWAALFAALLLSGPQLWGVAASNPLFGYSVDLPIGWVEAENSDAYHIGFLSPNGDAMIQIIALDPTTGGNGVEIADFMMNEMQATGETDEFVYQGSGATLTDLSFTTGGLPVRGYMVTLDTNEVDLAIFAFANVDAYEIAHDHLVSAIDSFALGAESRLFPGPISQYLYPVSGDGAPGFASGDTLRFLDRSISLSVDSGVTEAASALVDREARILAPYGALDRESFEAAWRRYFRMIYRDNFLRLGHVASQVDEILRQEGVPHVDAPGEILAWLQGFSYERTGGLSDFQPPLMCLSNQSGDCDSLGLTYVILLHHLGVDAILMASDRYAHALAAVDVQGPGARFAFEGRDWLVAELTSQVDLGQIAATMADPAGWIGVRLRLRAQS